MDQAAGCANPSNVADFVLLITIPKKTNSALIKDLYMKNRLAARQIGEEIGLAKSTILNKIRKEGIHHQMRGRDQDNYSFKQQVPFGYKLSEGRLLPNRTEMKVCRIIVSCRAQDHLSWKSIIETLKLKKIKNRKERSWSINSLRNIYIRWNGKV